MSVLLAADLLLERAANPSTLAGDCALIFSEVFTELIDGLVLAVLFS